MIAEKDRQLIIKMFFGPFEKEWKDLGGKIDNRSYIIAERLGLSLKSVEKEIDTEIRRRIQDNPPLRTYWEGNSKVLIFESSMNHEQ